MSSTSTTKTMEAEKNNLFPSSKKIEIQNTASLIDLKAELLKRKQEAVTDKPGSNFSVKGGACKWKKLAADLEVKGKDKELQRLLKRRNEQIQDHSTKEEDEALEKALRLSKEALERKSRLYEEKMKKAMQPCSSDSSDEEHKDEDSLVNFQEKLLLAKRYKIDRNPSANEETDSCDYSEEDWVEFTDSLGRTRKCLKQDLEYYKNLDSMAKIKNLEESSVAPEINATAEDVPPTKQAPLHYQDVKNNEVRDMGVGYFAFSTETDERKKQFQILSSLREQTLKQREMRMKLKDKKKMALEDRLKKVAERRGLNYKPKEEAPIKEDQHDLEKKLRIEDRRHEQILMCKTGKVREWDVGKATESGRTVYDNN